MNLKRFTPDNTPTVRKGRASVNINGKNGHWGFSQLFCESTGWKGGDRIAVFQDEQCPADWYICQDSEGFELKEKGKYLTFSSTHLARMLLRAVGYGGHTISFQMAVEPIDVGGLKCYAILTKSANG